MRAVTADNRQNERVRRLQMVGGAFAALALLGLVGRGLGSRGPGPVFDEAVVRQGTLERCVHEVGELEARDPVRVKAGMDGLLEWVVQDETWVNPGDRLFAMNVDEALITVTQQRTEMLGVQRELALERLRRSYAEQTEARKVEAALREARLAETRYRVLDAVPRGGTRLQELHEALLPIEADIHDLRLSYEAAQDRYQAAQDAYLEALEAVQANRDNAQYQRSKLDEFRLRIEAEARTRGEGGVPAELRAQRDAAEKELAALDAGLPELEARREERVAAYDAARGPRDELFGRLQAREDAVRELYIELEVEKRGVKKARLELDREVAQMELGEAERKLAEGQAGFAAGAISAQALETLSHAVLTASNELGVVNEKLAIASRPEPEEVLTEARLKMERAQAQAAQADELRKRALELVDRKIDGLVAKLALNEYNVGRQTGKFPEVLAFTIDFLENELRALEPGPEDQVRRAEIEAELARLRPELEVVRTNPPSIVRSPVAGIVRIVKRWDRAFQAGDKVGPEDILAHVYPAGNLQVRTAINQSEVETVRAGMPVELTAPALPGWRGSGQVERVSQAARDKLESLGRARSGVRQFDAVIRLQTADDGLRPGMTVMASIPVERVEGAVYVTREAVVRDGARWMAWRGAVRRPRLVPVEGRPFDARWFRIESGAAPGDRLLVRREVAQ